MSVKSSSCHPKCCMMTVKSIPGTFNFLSSKFFGECQSQSVHVWMLFYVSSVLSVWVSADLLSSGPCSLSVSLSLCLRAHSGLICLHKICLCWPVCIAIAHSIHPPLTPLSSNSVHTLTWLQRSAQRDTGEYVFEQISTSFPFSPWLLCSVCLCQSDTVIITP